ncbi:MAG: PEP-CTERM sorting domain-containing protein [Alphaproteobacteria bacterium]|nr:PEP-CTERM sorting domain-containing protein [Alphaproteobacteria bacterium]
MSAAAANAAQLFQLQASNIQVDPGSILFSNNQVSGFLSLSDSVAAGGLFGIPQIQGFSFNFGGITVTLPETQLPGSDLTAFGQVSANGQSISLLDLRFDLASTIPSCSFICAGQIEIGTFDNSNFVAIDDIDTVTLSFLQFDAALTRVPEPLTLSIFAAGLAGAVVSRRRKTIKG